MPALPQATVEALTASLMQYLSRRGKYSEPRFLDSGGSAAIFEVRGDEGLRAFKVFDPRFLKDKANEAEVRRLELQRSLVGHDCPYIVKTYGVDIDEGLNTAIIEMEFIEWPQLKKVLHDFPDEQVCVVINQLVDAVKYLGDKGIVHRDIKPENIHISPDFKKIKLLDLGVAREFDTDPNGAMTDTSSTRPFIATAQYSSPEYLFRLDAPSRKLWHGLNVYQVGAVLHDIIMKKQLFDEEIGLENRWLVARAVLSKIPSFDDGCPARLIRYKALATRCLSKDLESRIGTVTWDDFLLDDSTDPLKQLRRSIVTSKNATGAEALADASAKLEYLRMQHWSTLSSEVRGLIQSVCQADLPSTIVPATTSTAPLNLIFELSGAVQLQISTSIHWMSEPQSNIAIIKVSACLGAKELIAELLQLSTIDVASTAIGKNHHVDAISISEAIARYLTLALAIVGSAQDLSKAIDLNQVNGKEAL